MMSETDLAVAEKTNEAVEWRRTIARLPLTLRPALNQQLAQWDTLFPFERSRFHSFIKGTQSFSPNDLTALTASLRSIELKMGVDRWQFSAAGDTVGNATELARSEYYADWRREVQRVYEAVDAKSKELVSEETARRRLILLLLPKSLPIDRREAWRNWNGECQEIDLSSDAQELYDLLLRPQPGQKSIPDLLARQGSSDPADMWLIDADSGLDSTLSAVPSASTLNYADLKLFRDKFLAGLNTIPKDIPEADKTMAGLRQADWSSWCPPGLVRQHNLRSFVVEVFLSGNGALVFPNAFVEWSASEALRRARPRVVIARFGMRKKPRPFTSIAVFENQEMVSTVPDTDDPENSAIDAAILAHYVWLSALRYLDHEETLCLCISEHLNTALVVSPSRGILENRARPYSAREIYGSICSWLSN
jgi:hypothetical protein